MSDGVKVYDWLNKRFKWVVKGLAYNQPGEENQRPVKAQRVVRRPDPPKKDRP